MNLAIITSNKDQASLNIRDSLLSLFSFTETEETFDDNPVLKYKENIKLYLLNERTIFAEDLDKKIKADLFIFASKHSAKSDVKTLCIHTPGNWDKAEVGGKEKTLSISAPIHMKNAFLTMNEFETEYVKTMEVTHHGPYLEKPCFFIEIGPSEKEWEDKTAGDIIAKTIIEALEKGKKGYKTAILIGGSHYNDMTNKIMLRTNCAVGHVCPKYMIENISKELILSAIQKTNPKPELILIDWKGLGQFKQKVMDIIQEINLPYERAQRILKKSSFISKISI